MHSEKSPVTNYAEIRGQTANSHPELQIYNTVLEKKGENVIQCQGAC